MFLAEDSIKDVVVAAIQVSGSRDNITNIIKETVDALIAADLTLHAHIREQELPTSEAH